MLARSRHVRDVVHLLEHFPVVGLIGARQVGKTSLSHLVERQIGSEVHRFDLESPRDRARLQEPELALERLRGLVVLDEIQLVPDLFPVLRVLADRPDTPARFLVLASASPELLRQSSESLAGRITYHHLTPLDLSEMSSENLDRLWLRGGFPRSYLAATDDQSVLWRRDFVETFVARDLPQLGVRVPATTMRRFWSMLAHAHGQTWNSSKFASSFGIADTTARRYLDTLTSALVIQQLQPWFANVKKRQVRAPKVYFTDSGLLHTLLDLDTQVDLERHPQLGASWEGFVIAQVRAQLGAREDQCFHWATHAGAELDLLVTQGNRRIGFEVKRTASPRTTRSLRSAIETLQLDRCAVIHAGDTSFPLADGIEAIAARRILEDVEPLAG